jgi:hypothetical protein
MAEKWIVSNVSSRLQSVGVEAIHMGQLNEVEEGVFSTSPLDGASLTDRLVANVGSTDPLFEVAVADRETTPGEVFDVFGVSSGGFLVRSLLSYDGNEEPDFMNPEEVKELRYDRLSMSLPGQHSISLDGSYRKTIESVLSSAYLSGYNLPEGHLLSDGRRNKVSSGSGFSYEHDGGMMGSGLQGMNDLLDNAAESLRILPSGLAVVDPEFGESRTTTDLLFTRDMNLDDLGKIVAEMLDGRQDAVVRVKCNDYLLAYAILEATMRSGLGDILAEYTDGILPTSFTADSIISDDFARRELSEFVVTFGDPDKAAQSVVEEKEIDLSTFSSSDTITRLAFAGWTALVNRSVGETEMISLSLSDMGGAAGNNATELALILEMINSDTGQLTDGFRIDESSGRINIQYDGEYDESFAKFAKALMKMSNLS